MTPMPVIPNSRLIVQRRSAGSPNQKTEARYIQRGAEYCKRIAFAAVPRALALMKRMFMLAKQRPMTSIIGRNETSLRASIGVSERAAKRAR